MSEQEFQARAGGIEVRSIVFDLPAGYAQPIRNRPDQAFADDFGGLRLHVAPSTEDLSACFAAGRRVVGVVVGKRDDGSPALQAFECDLDAILHGAPRIDPEPEHGAEPVSTQDSSGAHERPPYVILDLYPEGRARVQRDMELIRRIVLAVQAKDDLVPRKVELDGVEDWVLARHVELLFDAGMLDGTKAAHPVSGKPAPVFVKDLSNAGHDFAASLANETVWGQIKQKVSPGDLAMMPLKVVKDLGVAMLHAWLMQKAGVKP